MIEPKEAASKAREVLGLLGFLLVATAQVSNMILARGVAGQRSAVLDRVLSVEHRGARPAAGCRDGAAGKARRVAWADARHRRGWFSRHVRLRRPGLCRRRYDFGDQPGADHGTLAARGVAVFFRIRSGSHPSKPDHRHAALVGGRRVDHYQGASRYWVRRGDRRSARTDGDAGLGGIHLAAEPCRQRCELSGADRPVRGGGRAVLAALRRPRNVVRAISRVQRARGAGLSVRRSRPRPFCLFGLCLSRREVRRGVDFPEPLSRADRQRRAVDPLSWRGADRDPSDRWRAVAWRHVVEPAGQAEQAA